MTTDKDLLHNLRLMGEALANNPVYNAPPHFAFTVQLAMDRIAALDKIIAAVRAYLPTDGMSAEQFISTVIEAVDNPEFNKAMVVKK